MLNRAIIFGKKNIRLGAKKMISFSKFYLKILLL